MKYTVHYKVPMSLEFESDAEDHANLTSHALWWARNKSGAHVELVQVLREGEQSGCGKWPPESPRGPVPPPPSGPSSGAGDQMLQRAA